MRGCSSLIITAAAPATCPLADEDSPNGAVVAVAATAEKSVERVCGAAAAATRAQRNEKKQQQHFITKECINTPMVGIDGSRLCYLQFPLLPTTSTAQLTNFTCKQTVKTIKMTLKLGQSSV